jgi:hypothetical protein
MLNFAKSFISSSKATDKPGKSPEVLVCDLFILEGDRWVSLSEEKCKVTFEAGAKSGPSFSITCDPESVSETFSLEKISNFSRFVDEEGNQCFQWISRKGKGSDNLEEFGIRFETDSQANKFASLVVENAQMSATVLMEIERGADLVERSADASWAVIEKNVRVFVSKTKNGDEYLSIQDGKGANLFHSAISTALQLSVDEGMKVVAFLGITPLIEDMRVLGLKFSDEKAMSSLRESLGLSKEKKRGPPKVIIEESSSDESEVSDVDMWEDPEEFKAAPVQSRRRKAKTSIVNKFLETGQRDLSKAFVFSLNEKKQVGFQVYDSTRGSKLESISSTSKIDGLRDPSALMLHEADRKCLLLDPTLGRDKVFELDLERGKVVNEWTPSTGSITALVPLSKESQKSDEKVFLGINDRSIFAIDPRMQPKEHTGNRAYSFTYTSNVKLSSAATDKFGHIVAANKIGELRLFDGETNRDGDLKKAKTLLSGFGDPITHVEVSSNGEYILATSANYLTLTKTVSGEISGFMKSLKSALSDEDGPMVLSLSPGDVAKYKLKTINFTPARFDETRNVILTSTGSLAVVFDMKRLPNYSIKPMNDFIIDIEKQQNGGVVAMFEDHVEITKMASSRRK